MPLLSLPSRVLTLPRITRESISWRSVAPGLVEVAVDLMNDGADPVDGTLEIAAAPLGAFVPAKPVARVAVGALEPGRRRRVTALVERRALPPPPTGIGKLFAHLSGMDAEIIELLDRATWDGNIHVCFEDGPSVEVHRALDIGVRAGQTAAATLFTGPQPTSLAVQVRSETPWRARTASMPGLSLLIVTAPEAASHAEVVVNVTEDRSGRSVPVEFSFDAR